MGGTVVWGEDDGFSLQWDHGSDLILLYVERHGIVVSGGDLGGSLMVAIYPEDTVPRYCATGWRLSTHLLPEHWRILHIWSNECHTTPRLARSDLVPKGTGKRYLTWISVVEIEWYRKFKKNTQTAAKREVSWEFGTQNWLYGEMRDWYLTKARAGGDWELSSRHGLQCADK